jgi:hypothetical protein
MAKWLMLVFGVILKDEGSENGRRSDSRPLENGIKKEEECNLIKLMKRRKP